MPAAAMAVLGARLARAGYAPRVFAYRGRQPFDANVERLARFALGNLAGRPAHFIGHSLGGVLILETLGRRRDIAVASAMLLGAPVRGSRAGRRLGARQVGPWMVGRWMMGGCEARWGDREARWERPEPLGVVAGTLPLGLGRALGRLPGQNDGVVCVDETPVDGMAARAIVPISHSMLIVSARVGRLVENFLAGGRFE
jgi:pimeloyl-ACP methyl ester carboxylesterase